MSNDWSSFDSRNPPGGVAAATLERLQAHTDAGVVELTGSGAPSDGTTGKDLAGPGARYTDTASGELYRNTGTKTSPVWTNGATIADVTATATELNTLDGVTATTAELNTLHSSGVTNADLVKLHAVTASAAEVSTLASSGVTNADLVKLHAVTASAAEVSTLASSGVTNSDLVKLHAVTAAADTLNQVAAAAGTVTYDRSVKVAKVALAALDTGGGVLAWANPEAGSILITRVVLDVTTKSTIACTIDVGVTAANATTSNDTLLDGLDVGTSAGVFTSDVNKGANGAQVAKLASGKWVTASKASGAAAGLAGNAYISYVNV